jgi:hypothetical protein
MQDTLCASPVLLSMTEANSWATTKAVGASGSRPEGQQMFVCTESRDKTRCSQPFKRVFARPLLRDLQKLSPSRDTVLCAESRRHDGLLGGLVGVY